MLSCKSLLTTAAVAVNTYFRAILAQQVKVADFEPRQYAELANCQSPSSPCGILESCAEHPATDCQALDSIPNAVLEHILLHSDLKTICNAAASSTSLRKVKCLHQFSTPMLVSTLMPVCIVLLCSLVFSAHKLPHCNQQKRMRKQQVVDWPDILACRLLTRTPYGSHCF